jgi:Cu+-exporting ATPase
LSLRLGDPVARREQFEAALAIVRAAEARKLLLAPVSDFDAPTGRGAVEGALGTARFMQEVGIATDVLATKATELRQSGTTVIFIAIDGKLAGMLLLPIRSSPRRRTRCGILGPRASRS